MITESRTAACSAVLDAARRQLTEAETARQRAYDAKVIAAEQLGAAKEAFRQSDTPETRGDVAAALVALEDTAAAHTACVALCEQCTEYVRIGEAALGRAKREDHRESLIWRSSVQRFDTGTKASFAEAVALIDEFIKLRAMHAQFAKNPVELMAHALQENAKWAPAAREVLQGIRRALRSVDEEFAKSHAATRELVDYDHFAEPLDELHLWKGLLRARIERDPACIPSVIAKLAQLRKAATNAKIERVIVEANGLELLDTICVVTHASTRPVIGPRKHLECFLKARTQRDAKQLLLDELFRLGDVEELERRRVNQIPPPSPIERAAPKPNLGLRLLREAAEKLLA